MGKINAVLPSTKLIAIRDQSKHNRKKCINNVLKCLGLSNDFISTEQFDALLIRAIAEHFDKSRDADLLLMAFGLLQGYHYTEITSIGKRRRKYLVESNYLQTHPRKQKPYTTATDEEKKNLEENLRKAEDGRISSLAGYLAEQTQKDGGIEKYINSHIDPIDIPQPSYILQEAKPKPAPADCEDGATGSEVTPYVPLVDDDLNEIHVDSPAEVSEQDNSEEPLLEEPELSEEIPPVDESETSHQSPPQQNLTYISSDTINNGKINNGTINHVNIVVKSEPHINLYWNRRTISLFIIMIAAVAGLVYFVFLRPLFVPVDKIIVPDDPINLVPNEKYELEVAIFPTEAVGAPLSYVSSDTSVVTVDRDGMLKARESHEVGGVQTADITIQAKSGATNAKTVTVNFSEDGYDAQDTVPTYQVEQRVRLAGTDEWKTNVENVKVGDLIEFRIKYTNTSDETQNSVMIKNILPDNLHYVPDSTVLTNAAYTLDIDQKTITTTGINIGHYGPGANAYVDFKAKVVDITLQGGSNTLVNWSQCGVGSVTLQDYTTVQFYK